MKKAVALCFAVCIIAGGCCNQNRLSPVPWADFTSPGSGHVPLAGSPEVAVTVRTDSGQAITVFGHRFDTGGEQRWIHGRSDTGMEPTDEIRISEGPFWTTGPVSEVDPRLVEFQIMEDSIQSIQARGGRPVWSQYSDAPEIYFEVNGYTVGVKPYTAHEGFLKRIHIDAPEGRSGNEVTVIGYYSRSAATSALEYPRKKCIWCGDTQVCTADARCT